MCGALLSAEYTRPTVILDTIVVSCKLAHIHTYTSWTYHLSKAYINDNDNDNE